MRAPAIIAPGGCCSASSSPRSSAGLERHLSAATEWFPHEYVPYEVGRNYVEEPWEETDSELSPVARIALEVNLLTEDNLPYYHLALWETFGKDGAVGRVDPAMDRRGGPPRDRAARLPDGHARHRPRRAGARADGAGEPGLLPGRPGGVVLEPARRRRVHDACRSWPPASRTGTPGRSPQDPLIEKLTARIAVDENLHYVFYRELAKAALELDPSAMVLAIAPAGHRVLDARAWRSPSSGPRRSRWRRRASTTSGSTTTRCCCRCCSRTGSSTS